MARALITGVTGFAGSHLAEWLLRQGDEVWGSSQSGQWNTTTPNELRRRATVFRWNLESPDDREAERAWREFLPTHVYHLAAISIPEQCGRELPTPQALAVNVEGTKRVLRLSAALPQPPRVLFVGTNHVYAPVSFEHPVVNESSPLGPFAPYGQTKLAAERAVQEVVARGELDAVIARVFKHAGPRQPAPLMLSEWSRQFIESIDQPIRVRTLESRIDLSDVRDIVRAYQLLLTTPGTNGAYNIGSGVNRSCGEWFNTLRAIAGPMRAFVETTPGRRQESIADCSRLRAATGWQPTIPMEQTVRDTFEYWRNIS